MKRMRRRVWIACVGLGMLGLCGCEKPLFPRDLPRTQYERYDRLRGQYIPAESINEFGGFEPALRERLSPPPD